MKTLLLLFALMLPLEVVQTTDSSVMLRWDANSEADLAGYRVYYSQDQGDYVSYVTSGVSISPEATVANLSSGTWYFVATALNLAGQQSGYSNEVSWTLDAQSSPCDIDGNGNVDVVDLQIVINSILGADCQKCDINQSGSVDVIDLQLLINTILGEPCQP